MLTVAATRGALGWSLDPTVALVVVLALLHWSGGRRTPAPAAQRRIRRWQAASFYAGLLTVLVAFDSPIERLSQQLFWVHMVQHVLLLVVAPPLIVLGRPWMRLWRALPLGWRRSLAGGLARSQTAAPLRRAAALLGAPAAAFVLFAGILLAWHVPALYDATLSSGTLHALEHGMFFASAMLFWKQVIPSPPLHAVLTPPQRVLYVVGAMIVCWLLAIVLALAPHPLYAHYAHLASRPGGISAIGDQQLAAGVMWVPGSITFVIVIFAYVHRWLMPPAPARTKAPRLAG